MTSIAQGTVQDYTNTYAEVKIYAMNRANAVARAKAKSYAETKAEAEADAYAKARTAARAPAKAEADAIISVTIVLYGLATDCLRLSMHFFHPIQQCAQQVYHSALPLSPTSSQLRKHCLQAVIDEQLSYVTVFSGAPDTWGLLLRTIDARPKQLTCIMTSVQRIIATCEDIVNIYDAVTFVLQQSFCTPEIITKIQGSPDGSVLFFAHSHSVTAWDVQTGGLIHTFTTQSKINDIAVPMSGDHIAYTLSDGAIESWNVRTKGGRGFGSGQPVSAICWLSPNELIVATQDSVYTANITILHTSNSLPVPGCIWGMVYLGDDKFLVGTSLQGRGTDQEQCSLRIISRQHLDVHQEFRPPAHLGQLTCQRTFQEGQVPIYLGQLTCPTYVGNEVVCITPPNGVQLFNVDSLDQINHPLLLGAATSIAVSLDRNLVAKTRDSIQIFSLDVLKTGKAHDDVHLSHIYPLDEKHIICLQQNRHLTLVELDTLRKLHPASRLRSFLTSKSPSVDGSFSRGFVAELGISSILQAWQSASPLPERISAIGEETLLGGLSPKRTRIITVYSSPQWEVRVKNAKDGMVLANLYLDSGSGLGEVYDLTFDSETRFYLKVDGPGWHVQIPHDIITSPSGNYSHTITQGEPEPLPEARATPSYTLDTNCEWVIDAESRKICWISPGNIRRGNGGHFWAGLSLVMVGDDGVVRKVSFKEPGC